MSVCISTHIGLCLVERFRLLMSAEETRPVCREIFPLCIYVVDRERKYIYIVVLCRSDGGATELFRSTQTTCLLNKIYYFASHRQKMVAWL